VKADKIRTPPDTTGREGGQIRTPPDTTGREGGQNPDTAGHDRP